MQGKGQAGLAGEEGDSLWEGRGGCRGTRSRDSDLLLREVDPAGVWGRRAPR